MSTIPNSANIPPKSGGGAGYVLLLVLVAMTLLLVMRRGRAPEQAESDEPAAFAGAPLPPIYLEPLTGVQAPLQPNDLADKVVLINYWGPWCGWCLKEFPDLIAVEERFRSNARFRFVSVSSSGDSDSHPSSLAQETDVTLRKLGATFPTYVDAGGRNRSRLATAAKLSGFGFPTTVLLDRQGRIFRLWQGYDPNFRAQASAAIEELLEQVESP